MKGSYRLVDKQDPLIELKITMHLSQWELIQKKLSGQAYHRTSSNLIKLINNMVIALRTTYAHTYKDLEDEI